MVLLATFVFYQLRVEAQPNQWMIVLRDGKMVKCGVGISCFKTWNDKIVTFPSKIHKVPFTAQQVTTEMQGVEVSGIIIWSIFRDGDGPLKAYKSLGSDIHESEPKIANQNLVEMANGIVRHKIANSTINEILRKRQEIRESIKKDLNKNINGWGVWLETVEITDVKILSTSLFENLQTEFRESQRKKATIISMKADNEMSEKKLTQNLEFAKKESENETKKAMIKSSEELKINLEKQKNYELEQEIKRKKMELDQELKKNQAEANAKLEEVKSKNTFEQNLLDLQNRKAKKEKSDEIDKFETQKAIEKAKLVQELEAISFENERKNKHKLAEARREIEESVPFEVYSLENIKRAIQTLPLEEVKIFNFTNEGKNNTLGSAIQQIISEFNVIKTQVKSA